MTEPSPSVAALRAVFGPGILRDRVLCGDSVVWVDRSLAHDVLAWLRETPAQAFNYLTDITAVDYRDPERPLAGRADRHERRGEARYRGGSARRSDKRGRRLSSLAFAR